MAKFVPALGDISGKIGNLVFARNCYGPLIRRRAVPVQARTPARATARGRMSAASSLYRQQIYPGGFGPAWIAFAANFPYRGAIGSPSALYLTGHSFSVGINTNRFLLDQAPILEPPDDWGSSIPDPSQTPYALEVVCISGTTLLVRMLPAPFDLADCGYIIRATSVLPGGIANPPDAAFRVIKVSPPGSNPTNSIAVGVLPKAIAVNNATNRIYVCNYTDNTVTAIVGTTRATSTIAVGAGPVAVACNRITNRIYVANFNSQLVTEIDGATGAAVGILVGNGPCALAVNETLNEICVANQTDNTVTRINGSTHAMTTVAVGTKPVALAVNPVTWKIYCANETSNDITVISGLTGATTTVAVGNAPGAIAVNTVTNKIYVACKTTNNVYIIDGVTLATTPVAVGTTPVALAVNQATNKVYCVNQGSNDVTVIDPLGVAPVTIAVGTLPSAIACNPTTNKYYVTNQTDGTVSIIDGVTHATTLVTVAAAPVAIASNPSSNHIYAVNSGANTVTDISAGLPAPVFPDTLDITTEYLAEFGAIPTPGQQFWVQLNILRLKSLAGAETGYMMLPVQTKGYPLIPLPSPIPVGTAPVALAVDEALNRVYVANSGSSNFTIILCDTNHTVSYVLASNPSGAASIRNGGKASFGCAVAENFSIFNPANGGISAVASGLVNPTKVIANPTTKLFYYVLGVADIAEVNADTLAYASLATHNVPNDVAVNPVTNIVYATIPTGKYLDWFNRALVTAGEVNLPHTPSAVAVNSVTNKIYVAYSDHSSISEIDGVTLAITAIAVTGRGTSFAINTVTNKIYVCCTLANKVAEVLGVLHTVSYITVPTSPVAICLNDSTDKIYTANSPANSVSEIDGTTHVVTPHAAGTTPIAIGVNRVTGSVYCVNSGSNDVTVI
jgi:YVTN family beta-propeller protein